MKNHHLLLCEPKYFSIDYQINPWMNLDNQTNHDRVLEQWYYLYNSLREVVDIKLIEPQKDLPDMVFTANAGLPILDSEDVLISKFKFPERSREEIWFKKWFEENGHRVVEPERFFEGAGDALYFKNILCVAHGFRSDPDAVDIPHTHLRLIDPRFYHLDTCFCPLQNGDYLIYPKAFSPESLATIRSMGGYEIAVPEIEALRFACNAVSVENFVFIPSNCPETHKKLLEREYVVFDIEMSEFLKSGGACKCLTLKI